MAKKIYLVGKNGLGKYALVDDEDYDYIGKYNWRLNTCGYVSRTGTVSDGHLKRKEIKMHRQIMGYPDGFEVDHINLDRLDNRKENLRVCTRAENMCNKKSYCGSKSHYKGVSPRQNGSWRARVYKNKVMVYTGDFSTEESAASAYNHYALLHHGEYAKLNDVSINNWHEYKLDLPSSSSYKGVTLHKNKKDKRWCARTNNGKKDIYIGYYETEIEAAIAYDIFILKFRGYDTEINFPERKEEYLEYINSQVHKSS